MQQLARAIRDRIEPLVNSYDARLRTMPGYEHLPESLRRDLEQHFLNILAQCLEKGDNGELVEYARQRAVQWQALGLNLVWFQQALVVPEEILVPLIQSLAAGNFVWRALNRSQNTIWQMIADQAQTTEERFRSVVETSHSGVLISDDTFHLTYVNDELTHISGYSREELLNTDFRQLLDEESRQVVTDNYLRRQRGEAVPPQYSVTFLRKDGHKRYLEMSAVLLKDLNGKSYTVAQVLDVTQQQQAEATLAQERKALRTLIDNLPDQIFFKDAQARVILNNLADARSLGVNSPEEAIGKSDLDFYPSELAQRYYADDMSVIRSGQPLINREEPGLDKNGQHRWLLTTKVPLLDNQGRCVGLVGMARDITRRKLDETALRESEARLRAIYEGSNDAIMLLNDQGFFDCNTYTLKLFHVESKEAFTRLHPSDLSPAVQPDGQDSLTASQQKIRLAFQQGYARFEWLHRRTTGEDFPAEVLLSAFEYGGQPVLQATVRDITERKQAEVQLAQSVQKQQKLTQRLRATIEATDELMRITDTDTLYRRAVELAREKLGVERCGLFIIDPTRQFILGTYGTDAQGRTLDERAARDPIANHATMFLSQDKIWSVQEAPQRQRAEGGEQVIGVGWVGGTAIRSAAGPIGIMYNDAALSGAPMDPDLQETLAVYCSMLGNIIERKQADTALQQTVEQQQQQARRLRAALEATDELIQITDLDLLYCRVVELAREKLDIERCGMWLMDPARQYLLGTYGTDLEGHTVDERTAKEPLEQHPGIDRFRDKLWFVNERRRVYYQDGKEVNAGTGWVVGTSLRSAKGPIGILYNDAAISGAPLDEELQNQFALYCSMVGNIIENKRLAQSIRESLTRRSMQVQTSIEVAQHVAAAPKLEELFHRVVTLIKERFNYYHVQLFRYVPAEDAVKLIAGYGEIGQKMLAAGHKLPMGHGVVGTAAATSQSILATNVTRDLDWLPNSNLPNTRGELAVPIKMGGGDAESQFNALKRFVHSNLDGVAITAIDPDGVAPITHNALSRGKPVVAISIDLGQDNQSTLVASVEHELGYLLGVQAGNWAKQHIAGDQNLKLGMLNYRTLPQVLQREQGIIDGIQAVIGERVTIVVSGSAIEAKEAAYLAQGWLNDHPDLNMIVAINDATALGAYQAAQALGWNDSDQFFIGGIDAVPEALAAIQQGGVYQATVNQSPEVMGLMAVRTLVAAIKGIPVKSVYRLHCAAVNRSNVAKFFGPARKEALFADHDVIPAEALSGLEVSGLRLGLSVLTLANPFFATLVESAQEEAQRLGVQLIINDPSHILGVLDVQSDQVNTLTDDDRLLLEGLCGQIASAMESTRLLEQLRRSEFDLSEASQIAKLAHWEYDVEKDVFLFNDQFYAIFHTTVEQQGGYQISSAQYAQNFVHPDDLPIVGAEIEKALHSTDRHYTRQLEHRILYADGGVGYISVNINIDRDEQGHILRYYGANQDITERRRIESERERFMAEQQRRAVQLQTVSEVSRAASSILNAEELLPQAAELIRARFGFYYVGIFLIDDTKHWAILQAGTGNAGQQMLAAQHRLEIGGNSMIGQCIFTQQARIALDVGEEAVHFDNPLLPLTHSEIALPLISRGRIMGAMSIQSDQPAAFNVDDITVLQSMADQIGNAVENAHLYEKEQNALADTDNLLRASAELNVSQSFADVLAVIREHTALGRDALSVAINVFDRPWTVHQMPQWIEVIGYSSRRPSGIEIGTRFPLAIFASATAMLRPDAPTLLEDLRTADVDPTTRALFMQQLGAKSVIFVPLVVGGQWIGYINVLFAAPTQFPEADVRRLEALVGQAAVAVQNMRNLTSAQQSLVETEASYHATQAIGRAQSTEAILEATTPVVQLLGMTRAALRMVTRRDLNGLIAANDYYAYHWIDQQWVLQPVLKDALVSDFAALRPLLRNPEEVMIYKDAQNPESFMPDVVRQMLLANKLQSAVATSITIQGEVKGFLMFHGPQALPETLEQRIRLTVRTLSDQMAVALQNRQLFEQTQAALEEVDAINRRLTGEAWEAYLHQQANRDLIWAADDEQAAPEALTQLDDQLATGEITLEVDPENEAEGTVTAPILLRGQTIGALRLRTPLNEWDEDAEALLADVAGHIAQAVENARLVEQTQRTAQRERLINEINARVRQSVDLDTILRTAVTELGQSLKAARVLARVGTTTAEGAPAPDNGRGKTND